MPEVKSINGDFTSSCRVILPKEPVMAKAQFTYLSQLLFKPFPSNTVIIIEESLRFPNAVKGLLAECRKFVKILSVQQEALCDYVPVIHVIKNSIPYSNNKGSVEV